MLASLMEDYPFLKGLDEQALSIIESHLVSKQVDAGEMLINGEQACWGFSFIQSGRLRVYRVNEEGREVTLYRLGKGDSCFMTIICSLAKTNVHAYVQVEEDAKLLILPTAIFEKYFLQNPSYLQFVFENLYGKFINVVSLLESVTFNSIESRMIEYFKKQSYRRSGQVILYKTHEQIAFDIGSTREVVSRTLKGFERRKLLVLERGKIVIKDIEKL